MPNKIKWLSPKWPEKSDKARRLPSKDHNGWRIRWVDSDGKRRSKNFPGYQEVVAELARLKGEVQAIKDGRAPRQTHVPTFTKFVEGFYKPNRNVQKRRPRNDESIIRNHFQEPFGSLPLTRITTAKVVRSGRYTTFQMAEVAVSKDVFAEILARISRLRCCTAKFPTAS